MLFSTFYMKQGEWRGLYPILLHRSSHTLGLLRHSQVKLVINLCYKYAGAKAEEVFREFIYSSFVLRWQ